MKKKNLRDDLAFRVVISLILILLTLFIVYQALVIDAKNNVIRCADLALELANERLYSGTYNESKAVDINICIAEYEGRLVR